MDDDLSQYSNSPPEASMTAVCCSQCFASIAKKDTNAAKLWLDCCAFCVKFEGVFKLTESRVPQLIKHFRLLEGLGFVSSADGIDVKIRVNGYDVCEKDEICLDTFCLDREAHKSSWI